jgi:SAM-dependent methyltransferase
MERTAAGLRWYQVVYRVLYRVGLVFWQRNAPPDDLVALIEGPSALPAGRALELGCGTGIDSVYLATRGWDVTAVDMVPKALAAARRGASTAGVTPRFIEGDVTRLPDLGVGDGYDWCWTSAASIPCPKTGDPHTSPACPAPRRGEPRCCCTGSSDRPRPLPCTPALPPTRCGVASAMSAGT